MFCIVAFITLAFLGIFSASYRELAKEAFDCVARRVTLRPCTTGFDNRMKSRILGSVISRSETAARVINNNFEILSWIFFLLMAASTLYAVRGAYLFYVTGSCSGLNEASFCLLDPKGESNMVSSLSSSCREKPTTVADLTLKDVDLTLFPARAGHGRKVVMVGCYGCSYTRKVYPVIRKLCERNGATLIYMNYPVKVQSTLSNRLAQCVYQSDPQKYWALNDILFSAPVSKLDDVAYARKVTAELGLDPNEVKGCLDDPRTEELVGREMDETMKTNFFGTPTVFIGDKAFVGPKPRRVYAIALNGLLYWLK